MSAFKSLTVAALAALTLPLILARAADAAPTLANGSFETPDVASITTYFNGSNAGGWTVGNASGSSNFVQIRDETWASGPASDTPYGSQWMWLGGRDSHAYIEQVVTGLVAGGTYEIGFAMLSEVTSVAAYRDNVELRVDTGAGILTQLFTDTSAVTACGLWCGVWDTKSFQFVATGTTATLRFTGISNNSTQYDPALDNVTITEIALPVTVPEPGTLALFGLGLAGLGLARRRKAAAYRLSIA